MSSVPRCLWIVAAFCSLPSAAGAEERRVNCGDCHPGPAADLARSAHRALRCQECHGGPEHYEIGADAAARLVRANRPAGTAFDHGAGFAGRPSRLEIPNLCGDCHADVARMNPYGLHTDQLARYKTSFHGRMLFEKQDPNVAVCTDCHGTPHEVLPAVEPASRTHPLNVPDMCASCHADASLMAQYDLPVEVVSEYRESVHGRLLLEQKDTGAPTCATCHGNHSAMPPGFTSVGAVCAQCHAHDAKYFSQSIHAAQPGFKGCVQCHGGGEKRHDHLIEKITQPAGLMIERYASLLKTQPAPHPEQVTEAIHPDPKQIINRALSTCLECHETLEADESLPKLFGLLDRIAEAEREYVRTANRLDEISRGVLLVESQRFKFQDAKTHLIALSPMQHTLDNDLVAEKVAELNAVCDQVNSELDELVARLEWRRKLLKPIWAFGLVFAVVLYAKYRGLKKRHVRSPHAPAGAEPPSPQRRSFLDWLIGLGSAVVGAALALPAVAYLWPAAKGGGAARVEVEGAADMAVGKSVMVQINGKPVIVVRSRDAYRAFSAACTHLGCLVKWDPAVREFKCPCHAATFDENGAVVSGPPPSPLPEYTVKEIGDKVYVSL